MNKIKLIVEIPNDLYSNLSRIQRGSDASQVVLHAVMDGTPLPEGHNGKSDVLDKIRAEIEKEVWNDVVISFDGTDEIRIPRLDPDDVFEIIDKYRNEVSE